MTKRILMMLCILAAISTSQVFAVVQYSQPAATFSAGGGSSSSAVYTNFGIIGQPGIVGASASTSYTADHGFLPVLGFWMVPLGLLVLSYEFAAVRRHRRRLVVWWEKRRQRRAT